MTLVGDYGRLKSPKGTIEGGLDMPSEIKKLSDCFPAVSTAVFAPRTVPWARSPLTGKQSPGPLTKPSVSSAERAPQNVRRMPSPSTKTPSVPPPRPRKNPLRFPSRFPEARAFSSSTTRCALAVCRACTHARCITTAWPRRTCPVSA